MKVLKFGGTSVGTVESLLNVKQIVESIPGNAVIVVSALGGLTDKLIATARMAEKGDEQWLIEMESIENRHFKIIDAVVKPELKDEVFNKVSRQLTALRRNYEGVSLLRSLPEKTLDIIVSFGERMSSVIVAAMVNGGKRYFSPDFIKTEKRYGKNIADIKLTEKLIKESFKNIGANEKAIVPGFISKDEESGEITNLGRGGSDFTGALIAAALDAEILEIWTDVDGFMTADPRIVKDALIIDNLSFTESMELCTFGAKVIYPPTIYPVFHKNIPIKILNTFNPTAPGTLITDHSSEDNLDIKGVTALKNISVITLEINSSQKDNYYIRRALNVLAKNAKTIIPVANPEPNSILKFAISSSDAKESLGLLTNEFFPEIGDGVIDFPRIKNELAAIAIVGKDMKNKHRLTARIGHSLIRNEIEIEASSDGNSQTTFLYIIKEEKCPKALPLIHNIIYP